MQRHRFHHNHRQSFGETRKDQCSSRDDLSSYLGTTYPACNAYCLLQIIQLYQRFELGSHRSVAGKHQLDLDTSISQLADGFQEKHLTFLFTQSTHTHNTWRLWDWLGSPRVKSGF